MLFNIENSFTLFETILSFSIVLSIFYLSFLGQLMQITYFASPIETLNKSKENTKGISYYHFT